MSTTHKRVVTVEVVVWRGVSLTSKPLWIWQVNVFGRHFDSGGERSEEIAHEAANRCAESLGPLWVQPEGEGT